MAGKTKAGEHPPPVMPYVDGVDAIEPPAVEYVAPNVDHVDSQAEPLVAVPPVMLDPVGAPEPARASKSSESKTDK